MLYSNAIPRSMATPFHAPYLRNFMLHGIAILPLSDRAGWEQLAAGKQELLDMLGENSQD